MKINILFINNVLSNLLKIYLSIDQQFLKIKVVDLLKFKLMLIKLCVKQ